MKYKDRKDFPDIEGFNPEGWEVIEKEEDVPEFVKSAIRQAKINISNRGGTRAGAGRPHGTKKEPTKQVRLPADIVDWIQNNKETSISEIRKTMNKESAL